MRAALAFALCLFAVGAQGAPASFFIEAELEQSRIYVGGETILKVRLLRAPGVPYSVLRLPALGDAVEVWSLGPARWFQTEREGTAWDVHERTYLLVPRRGGRLIIPGAEVEGPLRTHTPAREARELRGPQLVLEVRAPPIEASEPWLPARRLTLEESWSSDPAMPVAGAAVTRTILLRAEGLTAQRLPQLEMAAHPAFRMHHDQPELATEHTRTGTVGRVIQRIVLLPLEEGEASLPPLSVHWWDVETDTQRTAMLAGRTLQLRAALAPAARPVVFTPPITQGLAAALALLLAGALWWRVRGQPLRDARKQLRAACRANDARAARDALIQWWNAVSPGSPPPLLRRIGSAWNEDARAQLGALDAALYAGRPWNGREFWRRVRPGLRKTGSARRAPASSAPFFRLQASDATGVRSERSA